ncbi:NUDIX hydrolase [Albidovulum sp.]
MKAADEIRGAVAARRQDAGLCYRIRPGRGAEVLLITSRGSGRWVIPKGWPMKGRTAAECALREAFEEAGVEGRVGAEPLGLFGYDKRLDDGRFQPCIVSVHPIRVTRLRGDFPEKEQRRRRWFSPAKAAGKVAEPGLRAILAAFDPDTIAAPGRQDP